MADLGSYGRGAIEGVDSPPHRGLGAVPPAGVQGAEPPLGSGGKALQKLKPKNTSEASQKALWLCKSHVHR